MHVNMYVYIYIVSTNEPVVRLPRCLANTNKIYIGNSEELVFPPTTDDRQCAENRLKICTRSGGAVSKGAWKVGELSRSDGNLEKIDGVLVLTNRYKNCIYLVYIYIYIRMTDNNAFVIGLFRCTQTNRVYCARARRRR